MHVGMGEWAAAGTPIVRSQVMSVGSLAVLLVILIPLTVIVGGVILVGLKMLRGSPRGRSGPEAEEETRMVQEIYSGLARLDERVEALETLVLDRERKDESP